MLSEGRKEDRKGKMQAMQGEKGQSNRFGYGVD
jgi:hypothetical protein